MNLVVHHLLFTLQAQTLVHLGPQAGAQIRGGLWAALREFACAAPTIQGDPDHARTPGGLLQEVLRLAATLEVLAPSLPCAAELRADLRAAADDLAAAIEQTEHCEIERRRLHTAERMAAQMALRASERSRRLLSQYVGEEALG